MPKGEFDTPGPFRQMALGVRWNDRNVMGFNDNLDQAERDELTGLLNKGTHFEKLRELVADMKAVLEGPVATSAGARAMHDDETSRCLSEAHKLLAASE